jgi:Flp pilus assembly protein TadG
MANVAARRPDLMKRPASLLRRLAAPAIARGRAFARDERGVTVIEFAILGLPFFTVIFAILETAMMFFASQVLDSAVEDASRMIRTGQAQSAGYSISDFRTLMCGYTFNLFGDCSTIKIKVEVISSFSSANTNPTVQDCTETTCDWTLTETYASGSGRDVVQVSAFHRWPLLVVLPYFNLKNQPDNYRLISATRVFRNEPF